MKFRYRRIEGLAARIDHDGPLGVQPIQMEADGVPYASLDAVPHDGIADRAWHGKSNPRTVGRVFADTKSREEGTRESGTVVVNPSKIFGSEKADTFRKARDGTTFRR
jgi:hypothetical protein